MHLDGAIDLLLAERPGRTYRELAAAIKARRLYIKPSDRLPPEPKQVNARVMNKTYRDRYHVADGRVFPA
jgi:hypothetical protein